MTPLPVIECTGCGECCSTQGTPPMLMDEYDALPDALKWDRRANADRYGDGLPCIWFDVETKRCVNYDHRPAVCREFEAGGEDCLAFRGEPVVALAACVCACCGRVFESPDAGERLCSAECVDGWNARGEPATADDASAVAGEPW